MATAQICRLADYRPIDRGKATDLGVNLVAKAVLSGLDFQRALVECWCPWLVVR
jgi:hypothetical protein